MCKIDNIDGSSVVKNEALVSLTPLSFHFFLSMSKGYITLILLSYLTW